MSGSAGIRIDWSEDFIVIDSTMPLGAALRRIESATSSWIVVSRAEGLYRYAFHRQELLQWPPLRRALDGGTADNDAPFESALGLQEEHQSTQVDTRAAAPPIDRSWRTAAQAPSIGRYIEVGPDRRPQAVGTLIPAAAARPRARLRGARPRTPPASGAAPSEQAAARAPQAVTSLEDEGTTPVRHPSIDIEGTRVPGAEVTIIVDLLRQAVAHTQGGPIDVGTLAADWSSLDLAVHLQCPAFAFKESAQSTVTIRRNAASKPAQVAARIRADAPAGPMAVMAVFFSGTRFCGSAVRMFDIGETADVATPGGAGSGAVAVERDATPPDVTVYISKIDKDRPGRLRWLVVTDRFDGLPPSLEEDVDLGRDPAAEATALFKDFAMLERGQHTQRIEGFGSRLWLLAPAMFRAAYWALWDRYRRPLAIQFVSDEPHMPWELMSPARADESEIHPPLALKHAVARWIKRWDGYMRNRLPAGHIFTIAPKYASASRALKRAQTESEMLVTEFAARREDGKRAAVLKLLETAPPPEPVAILHFAGHGKFAPEAATHSNIKLEDGELAASEIDRPQVRLGRACRTLVFFNACEVGAAGAVFGEVGGWADAFLGRQFGGFIAPLWSVDDEDAGIVATELLERIFKQQQPIGAALRAVREAHGATSPTFYSYLFYGDVNARFAG